jgi:hypothetical protein
MLGELWNVGTPSTLNTAYPRKPKLYILLFVTGSKMEPYAKRCSATKITSAEKLMYICKNQLGK